MVDGDTGSDRMLDAMLRTGPHGDAFGANPDGLSLQKLRDNPHGIDLGALNRGCRMHSRPRRSGSISSPVHSSRNSLVWKPARRVGGRRPSPPDRSPSSAVEQLVDAQRRGAGQRQGPLHLADQPRRCCRTGRGRRRQGIGAEPGRRGHRRRRGHRHRHARRRFVPHGWGHGQPGPNSRSPPVMPV